MIEQSQMKPLTPWFWQ